MRIKVDIYKKGVKCGHFECDSWHSYYKMAISELSEYNKFYVDVEVE